MDGLDPMEVQPNHDTSSSGSEEEGDSEDVEDKRSNSDSLDSDEDWQAVLLASVQTGESAGCSAGRDEGRSQGRERVESGNQEGVSRDTSILVSDTPKTLKQVNLFSKGFTAAPGTSQPPAGVRKMIERCG